MAYNTTPFHGKTARIEKNDVATNWTTGWDLNVTLDLADASRQGQHWKESLPGQAGWSGSFSGQLVLGNTEQKAFIDNLVTATPGTKLEDVKFLLDASTNAFTGNIYIPGLQIQNNLNSIGTYTFNFTGDGALSVTSSA
jgi:predicted secreted protein